MKDFDKNQNSILIGIQKLLDSQLVNGGYCSDEEDEKDEEELKEDNFEESSDGVISFK